MKLKFGMKILLIVSMHWSLLTPLGVCLAIVAGKELTMKMERTLLVFSNLSNALRNRFQLYSLCTWVSFILFQWASWEIGKFLNVGRNFLTNSLLRSRFLFHSFFKMYYKCFQCRSMILSIYEGVECSCAQMDGLYWFNIDPLRIYETNPPKSTALHS